MSCQETFTAPSTRFGRARMRALVFFLALSSVSAWRVPSSSEAASKKPSAASPTEKEHWLVAIRALPIGAVFAGQVNVVRHQSRAAHAA